MPAPDKTNKRFEFCTNRPIVSKSVLTIISNLGTNLLIIFIFNFSFKITSNLSFGSQRQQYECLLLILFELCNS